ncbi:MAG: hypothetical protein AAGE59_16320 [Cyanobacteria bacterium P01_F01_bin.86]
MAAIFAYAAVMLFIETAQPASTQNSVLSELPDGEHYYLGHSSSELFDTPYVLFHKWGRIVVGVDSRSPSGLACFKGFIEDNTIVDATRVLPPYTPDAEWDYRPGEMLDLSNYERHPDAIAATDRSTLSTCLDVFAR